MAAVPKGFLRYNVLRFLSEKPMSGSEIMNEIHQQTRGHWKPSPGSIYPLLAWLQDKGYTEEAPTPEQGIKRYTLTDQGKAFLQELQARRQEIRKRTGFFTPPLFGFHHFNHQSKSSRELLEAGRKLAQTSWTLLDMIREQESEDASLKAKEIIQQATKQLEEVIAELNE